MKKRSVQPLSWTAAYSPKIKFTAFSALLDADTINLLSFFRTFNQLCIYAVVFLKVFTVSIPNRFMSVALPISATSSSLLYSSEPKAAICPVCNLSSLVLCPVLCVIS